jgi:hypothetical protein
LHDDAGVGVGVDITLQRSNLPTHGANWLYGYCIHIGRNAAQQKRGSHEATSEQITEDPFIPRHPYLSADNAL